MFGNIQLIDDCARESFSRKLKFVAINTVPPRHQTSGRINSSPPIRRSTTKPRQFSRYTKLQLSLGLVYTRQLDTHTPAIMTSTIGIPIKLLNEAQVRIFFLGILIGEYW